LARSRSSGFQRAGGSSRRRTGWEEGPTSDVTALSAAGGSLWSTGQLFGLDGLTIARIRGEILIWISSAATALDGFQSYAVGIGVVTSPALAIGVTAVPTPLGEPEWEGWLWYHSGAALTQPLAAEGAVPGVVAAVRLPIDTKAMRKVGTEEIVYGAFEVGSEVGTAVVQYSARTRMLLMLP